MRPDRLGEGVLSGRVVLLVVGMHRSGTSAVSGALNRLGVAVPGELLPPAPQNPLGFFENRHFVALNDAILDRLGARWDSLVPPPQAALGAVARFALSDRIRSLLREELAGQALSLFKDPRLCVTAPIWLEALAAEGFDTRALLPIRAPEEVARSLETRDGLPRPLGLALWLHNVLAAERATRGLRRSILRYDAFLADWRSAFATVADHLELRWPASITNAGPEVDVFVRPDLRHHRQGARPSADALGALCNRAWSALCELAEDPDAAAAEAELDDVASLVRGGLDLYGDALSGLQRCLRRSIEDANAQREEQERHIVSVQQEAAEANRVAREAATASCAAQEAAEARLRALESSTIWRLTQPLRHLMTVLPVLRRLSRSLCRVGDLFSRSGRRFQRP